MMERDLSYMSEVQNVLSELEAILTRMDACGLDIAAAHVHEGLEAIRRMADFPSLSPTLPSVDGA